VSVNLFGMVEIRDRETGKWEYAPLYRKDKNGEYKEVDMFRGQSSYVNAVFGREPFDSSEEYFTSKSLDAIADIISGGRSFPMEELSDTCRKKLEINFDIGYAYFTCFTGQEINILGVLAGQTSKEAYDFFTTFFGNIVSVLDVVGTSYDVYDLRRIRVILYAV
jgi:hypothetical protein